MKKIIVFLAFVSFLSFGCRPTQPVATNGAPQNNTSQNSPANSNLANGQVQTPQNYSGADYSTESQPSVGKSYINTKMGFSLNFAKNWYLPAIDDRDPHFYETKDCLDKAELTVPCVALEIQSYDASLSPESGNQYNNMDGTKATTSTKIVPGATVVITDPDGGAEGWSIEYQIFFNKQKKAYLVYSNNSAIEKTVLSSFKLIP